MKTEPERTEFHKLRIHRRSPLEWARLTVGLLIWVVGLWFFYTNAIASDSEREARAESLFWLFFGLWLGLGLAYWLWRTYLPGLGLKLTVHLPRLHIPRLGGRAT